MKFLCCLLAVVAMLLTSGSAEAQLSPYSQDFETLDPNSPSALGDDGWLVFANVFGPGGAPFLYNYGPFAAPNGSGGFSNVTTSISGAPVGDGGIVTFSDYNNGDHGVGNLIETNVFQEQIVGAGDVGKTATFSFVAAPGDLGGSSTALAFIKTLDPGAGFALTNFLTFDTTSLPVGNTSGSLSLPIDGSLPGQIFQFGFLTEATSFEPSGVNYDNINFVIPEPGTISLSAIGACALLCRKRRNRH